MLAISSPERNLVSGAFQLSRETRGYLDPFQVAQHISSADTFLYSDIYRTMLGFPTRRSLFRGAEQILKRILQSGNPVAIWTDEYEERIHTSGLEGFGKYGDLSLIHGVQKQQVIPHIFTLAKARGVNEIVVVDNKRDNLRILQEYATMNCPDVALTLLLVGNRQIAQSEVFFPVVSHVRKADMTGRRVKDNASKRLIVFDFNGTLHDTAKYERLLERKVTSMIKQRRK